MLARRSVVAANHNKIATANAPIFCGKLCQIRHERGERMRFTVLRPISSNKESDVLTTSVCTLRGLVDTRTHLFT